MKKNNPFIKKNTKIPIQQKKLVGAYLPLPLANEISLLSVYLNQNIQDIIKIAIESWKKELNKSEEEIIHELSTQAYDCWTQQGEEYPSFEKYKKELIETLGRRKVSTRHTELIIEEMEYHIKNKRGVENAKDKEKTNAKPTDAEKN